MKCIGCDKEAITTKGWCSLPCYRLNQRLVENSGRRKWTTQEKVCEYCSKIYMPTGRGKAAQASMYCSVHCAGAKLITLVVDNCKHCGVGVLRTPSQIKNDIKQFCSRNCYEQYNVINGSPTKGDIRVERVQLSCQFCKKLYEKRITAVSTSKFCSIRCHNMHNIVNTKKTNTSIERAVESILIQLRVDYKKQVPLLGLTIVDFMIGDNLIIYADGDYWHSLPESAKRDVRNNRELELNGYKCLRLLGSLINKDINLVKEHIESFITSNSNIIITKE